MCARNVRQQGSQALHSYHRTFWLNLEVYKVNPRHTCSCTLHSILMLAIQSTARMKPASPEGDGSAWLPDADSPACADLAAHKTPAHASRPMSAGGLRGFDKRIWTGKEFVANDGQGVRLTYSSKDGEEVGSLIDHCWKGSYLYACLKPCNSKYGIRALPMAI